ncbi:MAG: NfeD family protein [Methanosarcinales archaeon]|nr:NfeD family protein [Methanosarcinales archaeon]
MVAVEIGLVMLIFGIGLLVAESMHPGFFIAVPGTLLLVLGSILIILPDMSEQWLAIIMVATAFVAGVGTILLYRKIAPVQKPSSTSMDSLVGRTGIVVTDIEPGSINGKVRIISQIWSATSNTAIPKGRKIEVVQSEGVHVKVIELNE